MAQRILIVEDEAHLATGIRYNLLAEGFEADVAPDGTIGLKMAQDPALKYDLIVLDLMLPGINGYTICQTIRKSGNNIPVLILSARTLSEDRTRGFEVGANQYLTKPFELDEFLARVRNLLRLHGNAPVSAAEEKNDQIYQLGNAVVDFRTFEVSRNGEIVVLTSLEMKLLRYFIRRENEIVTREELQENVWEIPADVNTRAVDQFIRRLRKIFEEDPANPTFFITVRNVGYRYIVA